MADIIENTYNNLGPRVYTVTPLEEAVTAKNLTLVQELFEITEQHAIERSLQRAVSTENYEITKFFLEKGVNPNFSQRGNIIDRTDSDEIKDLLLEHGCFPPLGNDMISAKIIKFYEHRDEIKQQKLDSGFRTTCLDEPTIAHKLHYIWITNPESPREALAEHLEHMLNSTSLFRNQTSYNDWSYEFYTNAPELLPNTTRAFTENGFTIVDLRSQYSDFVTGSFIDLFIKSNKFGLAADLARYEILSNEGGIYLDLNYDLSRGLDHEVCAYGYVNYNSNGVENYFIMSASDHPILKESINDIYSSFYGNANSEKFWQHLNSTNSEMTDVFFGTFSFNNAVLLTQDDIIYNFDESDNCSIESDNLSLSQEQNAWAENIYDWEDKCFDPNFYQLIGDDGEDGESWV